MKHPHKTAARSLVAYLTLSMLMAFFLPEATAQLAGQKIGIDPGHGHGVNQGVYIAEGTWTLDSGFRTRTHLQNHGANVVMTRTTGADPALSTRVNILNSNNVNLAISLHSNAASAAAHGMETYWCNQNASAGSSQNLANKLRIRLLNMVHNDNRGTKECLDAGRGFHFYMVRYTNMPTSLPEAYFHTNVWENGNIHNTPGGRENVAQALYAGVCDYYGVTPFTGGGFDPVENLGGYYRVKAKHSGKYFDMGPDHVSNGASLQQFDWHGGSNQVYQLTHLGDGYYRIRSKSAPETRVLDVSGCGTANGSNVHQWDWFDNDCQKFRIEDVGGGYVRFVAKNSGRVLEVGGGNGANGANINIWDWNGGDHQKFQVEWVSIPVTTLSGAYKVASAHNGRVLDIAPDHTSNGAVLQVYDWLDVNNQKFTFDHLGGGWYKIWAASAGSNRVLDVPSCDFSNGTPLWQWDWANNDCQKFLVEEVAPGQVRMKSVGGTVVDHGLPGGNGTNVAVWDWWGGANQRWILESTQPTAPPQEFIVDNADAGFSASGSWSIATWASDKHELNYHYRATESISDAATWTVNLPSAGTYAVYAWWTAASNRATTATYVVGHAGGTANVQVDQTQNGGQWNSLGSYSMNAGANDILLSCWTTSGDVVVADAVRYVEQ